MDAQSFVTCRLPETVNYHFTPACNMQCAFCFSGFADCGSASLERHKAIIQAIASVPCASNKPRRLNFAGGEPTSYPHLDELILEAHTCGLRTSVVTNGFNLVRHGLPDSFQSLELLGLSIDSLAPAVNRRTGRCVRNEVITEADWLRLAEQANAMGLPIKINTTVTAYNADEDLSGFVERMAPRRWKIFQGIVVEGQNDHGSGAWAIEPPALDRFVRRNAARSIQPVVEPEELMRGSYAMISPDGRFYDSTLGGHSYSDPILNVGMARAWSQIQFDSALFDERTHSYSDEEVRYAA